MDLQILTLFSPIIFNIVMSTFPGFPAVALVAESDWLKQVLAKVMTHRLSSRFTLLPWVAQMDGSGEDLVSHEARSNRLPFVRIRICDTQNGTYGQVVTGST